MKNLPKFQSQDAKCNEEEEIIKIKGDVFYIIMKQKYSGKTSDLDKDTLYIPIPFLFTLHKENLLNNNHKNPPKTYQEIRQGPRGV